MSSDDLGPQERERVQGICRRAGIANATLLEDCMLDVSVLGSSAADVFVNAPIPAKGIAIVP